MSYTEQLRDPRWQKKRLRILDAASWECRECGATARELHVHHYWYEPRTAPWEYSDDCFGVLCNDCHSRWHAKKLELDKLLAGLLDSSVDQALGLLTGLRCITEYQDYIIESHCDPMFVTALVRGFWPPSDFQRLLIDDCLIRIARGQSYAFSEAVERVVPDCTEYAHIYAWVESVSGVAV